MIDPRWLDAAGAAAHLSLTESAFLRRVRAGVFPRPTYGAGAATPRWDRLALDAKLGAGIDSTDARTAFQGFADAIAAKGKGPSRPADSQAYSGRRKRERISLRTVQEGH